MAGGQKPEEIFYKTKNMSDHQLINDRKAKIKAWEEKGFSAYAHSFERTHTSAQARIAVENTPQALPSAKDLLGKTEAQFALCGRIIQNREMGKLAFLRLRDGAGDFQICLAQEVLKEDFKWFLKNLDLGDFAGFSGEFFVTKHGEPTLMATQITPLSKSLRPLPEKFHGLKDKEICYRERNLDLTTNPETFDRFKKRSAIVREIREFFWEKNYEEVETRILQPQAGGAMAEVFKTHHNALDHEFVLRIATELDLKMTIGGGFEGIFEIGKSFRNEGIDPSHLQEFTSIEWYGAYQTLQMHEQWIEELLHRIAHKIFKKDVFSLLDKNEQIVEVDLSKKFKRVAFAELLKEYAGIDLFDISMEDLRKAALKHGVEAVENRGRGNLLDDIYKKTVRPNLIQPTFVVDWPSDLKPLARPHGNSTSAASQLLIAGWEVTNGYGELIDPQLQRQLLEDQQSAKNAGDKEAMEVDEVFLKAMEHGFPPMAGNAIGIDRLCALLCAQPNLRDVVLFPTMKPEGPKSKPAKELQIAVALINQDSQLEKWQELNTIAHLSAAFGTRNGSELFKFDQIQSLDGQNIAMNIQHAILIKNAPDNTTLKSVLKSAQQQNLQTAEFTREMLETTNDNVVSEKTAQKKFSEVEHLGILIFGNKSNVEALTKDFDLHQ
jgi:lysyl-tRNA synthetase, class II